MRLLLFYYHKFTSLHLILYYILFMVRLFGLYFRIDVIDIVFNVITIILYFNNHFI